MDQRRKAYDVFPQVVVTDEFMRRVDAKQEWTLVDPYEVKEKLGIELAELWGDKFDAAYAQIESALDKGIKLYKRVDARHLFKEIMRSQIETGMPYIAFKDTINRANPNQHEGYIPGVNLCVAPETKILTNRGYETIGDLENQAVTLWNGEEWSETTVVKTGENQELLKVNFSNGESVECTPYHGFPIQTYKGEKKTEVIKVEAKDLQAGDRLIKFDLPVISSDEDQEMDYAYTHGFFCGDGSHDGMGKPEIDLYGKKKELLQFLDVRNKMFGGITGEGRWRIERDEIAVYDDAKQDRLVLKLPLDIHPKFFVPLSGYTIASRLAWLAGLLDADGTVCRQESSESFQLASVNKSFLLNIRLMLHTLGVDSKVKVSRKEGDYFLPDGHGALKEYHCKTVYRLLISSYGLHRLAVLGLRTNRLKWVTRDPGRNGERYIRVDSVERTGRISDVFCFHEVKRNMGMFNGLLLHQCVESFSVVLPGRFAHSCNLDSINLANVSEDELPQVCETAVRLLDNTIDITTAPFQDAKAHNDRYRTIGVGAMGLADWLAKRQLTYKSVDRIANLFENIGYYCTRASVDLAKERGAYAAFEGSEWSKGHLIGAKPIEWYRENASSVQRWEALSADVQQYGIRNSHITAIAPNTSSSLVQGCTASILPAYSKFFYDKWAKGTVPIAPPFIGEAFWFYHENKSMDQQIVVKAVAEMQKWIDTGISMELIFNLNKGVYFSDEPERAIKAKNIFETMMLAWKEGCKAIYYIRTVQKDDFKENAEACSSCAN